MGRQCEPWGRQPLVQGYIGISASSCYQLCNGESVGRPWCYQLDVYTSILRDVVAVVLSSEDPTSYAILGVLVQDYTCGVLKQNRIDGEDRDLSMTLFFSRSPVTLRCKVAGLVGQ